MTNGEDDRYLDPRSREVLGRRPGHRPSPPCGPAAMGPARGGARWPVNDRRAATRRCHDCRRDRRCASARLLARTRVPPGRRWRPPGRPLPVPVVARRTISSHRSSRVPQRWSTSLEPMPTLAPGLAAVGWEFRMMLCGMARHRCRALPASGRLAVDSELTDERCPRWCRC